MSNEYKIRWSEAERRLYQGAADIAGLKLAQWIRATLTREARRVAAQQGQEQEHEWPKNLPGLLEG